MALTPPIVGHTALAAPQEKRHLYEVALLLVVISLFSWFVVRPKVSQVKGLRSARAALVKDHADIDAQKQKLDALVNEMRAQPQVLSALDETLPRNTRTTTFPVLIEQVASASGLSITSLSLDAANSAVVVAGNKNLLNDPFNPDRKLLPVVVNVAMNGTLDQLLGFMQALEKSVRIVDTQTIDITPAENGGSINFKVKLKSYEFPPTNAAPNK